MSRQKGSTILMTFAELTGAHTYIVHLSNALRRWPRPCERVTVAFQVWVETLVQYLTLDKSYAERPKF